MASILNKKDCQQWTRGAFADAVKDTFCRAFNVDRAFIEKWKRINTPPPGFAISVRQGLQKIGEGFRQNVPDIWIEIALRDKSDNLIISDGRYINEAKAVCEKKGINVLIYRDGFLNNDSNLSEAELRPLLEYANDFLSDGEINFNNIKNFPAGLEYFHFFIRNDSDKESFLKAQKTAFLKAQSSPSMKLF